MRWLRESELKHGRVAMLATVGFVATEAFTFPGVPSEPNSVLAASSAPPELWTLLLFAAGWIESSVYDGKITMLDMFDGTDRVPGNLGFGSSRLDSMTEEESKLMQYKDGDLTASHRPPPPLRQAPGAIPSRGADFESIMAVFDQTWPKTVENKQKRTKNDPESDS